MSEHTQGACVCGLPDCPFIVPTAAPKAPHSKSGIADELAWRDARIAELERYNLGLASESRALQEREQALAAHVDFMKKACRTAARKESRKGSYAEHIEALDAACEQPPATSLARLKEDRIQAIQQAVSRARKGWADQASPEIKAEWQAEVLERMATEIHSMHPLASRDGIAAHFSCAAKECRRQAEGIANE